MKAVDSDISDLSNRRNINYILLCDALLSEPSLLYGFKEQIEVLRVIAKGGFDEADEGKMRVTQFPQSMNALQKYWTAAYAYKKAQHVRARQGYAEVIEKSQMVPKLRDLAHLQIARIDFREAMARVDKTETPISRTDLADFDIRMEERAKLVGDKYIGLNILSYRRLATELLSEENTRFEGKTRSKSGAQ